LVNTGFRVGAVWDNDYNGMKERWQLFLLNLRLHLQHFKGRTATAMLLMATWSAPTEERWATLTRALGLRADLVVGDRLDTTSGDAPPPTGKPGCSATTHSRQPDRARSLAPRQARSAAPPRSAHRSGCSKHIPWA
jgi:hypothetical protein